MWCSAGLNRLIVYPNGNISRCYSRPSHTNIWNFDINKDIHPWKCNELKCHQCDNIYTERHGNKDIVKEKCDKKRNKLEIKRGLLIEFTLTDVCPYFCPYCVRSDRDLLRKNDLVEVEMKYFIKFLEKLPYSLILFSGGEPTLRPDIGEILKIKNHDCIIFSSMLHNQGIKNIIKASNFYRNGIDFIPTLHHEALGFNFNKFWKNVQKIINHKYLNIKFIKILDYKTEGIISEIINICNNIGVKYVVAKTDYTIVNQKRIDWNYVNNIKKNITYENSTQWNEIKSDDVFGMRTNDFKKI